MQTIRPSLRHSLSLKRRLAVSICSVNRTYLRELAKATTAASLNRIQQATTAASLNRIQRAATASGAGAEGSGAGGEAGLTEEEVLAKRPGLRKAKKSLDRCDAEIAALTMETTAGAGQYKCAYVTFDEWEHCQNVLAAYRGLFSGYLCAEPHLRMQVTPKIAPLSTSPLCASCWELGWVCCSSSCRPWQGSRLKVRRAPEP